MTRGQGTNWRARRPRPQGRGAGVILLEVVLALALLVLASAVLGSAMRRSLSAVADMRRRHKASNIAESVLAQVATGAIEAADTPATELGLPMGIDEEDEQAAEAEAGWTYEIVTEEITDTAGLLSVTVTIRHEETGEGPLAELTQWLPAPAEESEEDISGGGRP